MNNTLKKIIKKTIIYGSLLFLILEISSCDPSMGYPLRAISRPINQILFAKKTNEPLGPLKETYEAYTDPRPNQIITINGQKIKKTFVNIYRATGYVLYSDRNDNFFRHLINNEKNNLRDDISLIDMYLVFGKTADRENLKTIKFKHSDNMLQVKYSPYTYFNPKDLTEIYVIPTTYAIKRAVKTINRGDIVSVVGYIANWQGTDNLSDVKFESAQYPRESKNYKYLFVTKLILNGYVYE